MKQDNKKWNRQIFANTTDGLTLINDLTYEYNPAQYRQEYDPSAGSAREYVWTDDAACNGVMPELFQLSHQDDPGLEGISTHTLQELNFQKVETAKKYCDTCPVKKTCLETASTSDLHWSIRGGQTPTRLTWQKRPPSFPYQDYTQWECVKCGSNEYGLRKEKNDMRKYCRPCANGKA